MTAGVRVGFTSGKGSPGATWCLANTAAALARAGHRVLALDLDPCGGTLAAHLGLSLRRGLLPLARMKGPRPTPEDLRAEAEPRHGFEAVAGLPRASDAGCIDLPAVARAAGSLAPFVLADAGRLPGPGLPVLAACDRVLLVVRPDPAGILAAEQALVALEGAVPKRSVSLVASGLIRRWMGDLADLRTLLGRPVTAVVPLVSREARRAATEQRPVRRGAARAFGGLAAEIARPTETSPVWKFEEATMTAGGAAGDAASS